MISITSCTILISAWWVGQRYSLTVAEQQFERADYFLHSYLQSQAALLKTSVQGIVTDYGFRQTIADGDPDTIDSMVENHARRVGLDFLVISDMTGQKLASLHPLTPEYTYARLRLLLENMTNEPKVVALNGGFYWLVVSQIKAPHPVGIAIAGLAIDNEKLEHAHAITGLDITIKSKSRPYSLANNPDNEVETDSTFKPLTPTLAPWHRQTFNSKLQHVDALPTGDVSLYMSADLSAFHQQFDRFSHTLLVVSAVLVGLITLFSLLLSRQMFMPLERLHKNLLYRASHDDLTSLQNRVTVLELLTMQLAEAQRNKSCFFVALLDIDHFKQINDSYGHSAGDGILTAVASRLKATLREYDLLGRYGGEEFIVSANEQLAGCEARLLRLKQAISKEEFNYKQHSINLTISIGACFIDFSHFQAPLSPETLIELADKALYEAKAQGRNRVVLKHHDGTRFEHKTLC